MKQVSVLLLAFLALLVSKNAEAGQTNISPYDILDDAKDNLEALRELVESSIVVAEDDLVDGYNNIVSFSEDTVTAAAIAIDQEYQSVVEKLNTIKELAAIANKDISRCTSGREQMIHQLPTELNGRVQTCIVARNEDAASILDDSKYYVDVTVTKVNNFEFQLGLCDSGSLVCIQSIVSQIELANVQLPQSIQVEVNKADDLLENLRAQVQQCSDMNVSDFSGYVNGLVEDIGTCAGIIISK